MSWNVVSINKLIPSKVIPLFSLTVSILFLNGCTVGEPEVSSLTSLSGITFSSDKKSSEAYSIVTSPQCSSELSISGSCDKRLSQLEFSIDEEVTWARVTGYNSASDGDCSDGKFTLYFQNICSTFNVSTDANVSKKVFLRGDRKLPQNTTSQATISFNSKVIEKPKLSLTPPVPLGEGANFSFQVTLDKASTEVITVDYSTTLVSATAFDIPLPPSGSLSFAAGETSKTVLVTTADNTIVCEADKVFFVNLTNPSSGATLATFQAQGTIVDLDRPTLSIIDMNGVTAGEASVTEGAVGLIRVQLSQVCPTHDISFRWSTSDSTATVTDEDYTPQSNILTMIPMGSLSVDLSIPTTNDSKFEIDEDLMVTLMSPIEASILVGTGVLQIVNDDLRPTISILGGVVMEGDPSQFTVSLSNPSTEAITVSYTFNHVTTTDADFAAAPGGGSLSFAPGETNKVITFLTNDDSLPEVQEKFFVQLGSTVNATIFGTGQAYGNIIDNDPIPSITLLTPTTSPSVFNSIEVQISGVSSGNSVSLFTDNCNSQIGSAVTASGPTVNIPLTVSSSGIYTFKAKLSGADSASSPCSTVSLNYEYRMPVVVPTYTNAPDWNDYVQYPVAGSRSYRQPPGAAFCTGSELGYYNEHDGCIHGGELRKLKLWGVFSCVNVTMITEALGVFEWVCEIEDSVATLFTKGFKNGKGLKDLIDFSAAPLTWKNNHLVVIIGGSSISTPSSGSDSLWWGNPIANLHTAPFDNSASTTVKKLNTSGTIYAVPITDLVTYGYQIDADKIAVVTDSTTKIKAFRPSSIANNFSDIDGTSDYTPNMHAVLSGGGLTGKKYIWIEANIDGVNGAAYKAHTGIMAHKWKFSRIHESTVSPMETNASGDFAVKLKNSDANLISGLNIFNIFAGLSMNVSDRNIVRNINIADVSGNSAAANSLFLDTANLNRFYDLRVANHKTSNAGADAILLKKSSENIYSRLTAMNINGSGKAINLNGSGGLTNQNIFSQVLTAFTDDTGINIMGSNVNSNIFTQLTIFSNVYNAIYFGSGTYNNNSVISLVAGNMDKAIQTDPSGMSGSGNLFQDLYLANGGACAADMYSGGLGVVKNGYFVQGNFSSCGSSSLCSGSIGGGDLTNAFVGAVTGDDSLNPLDTNGLISSAITNFFGWFRFDSRMRGLGRSNSTTTIAIVNQGFATFLPYRIWDFRAAHFASSNIYNTSYDGVSRPAAPSFDSVSQCNAVSVALSPLDIVNAGGKTFLRNAIEIDGDGVGNDNSLCEASEDCIYAPNIGADQGEGRISSGFCIVDDGGGSGLDGIRVFYYLD